MPAAALVLVDAYQTVGTVPVDVQAWQADFVVGGSHKWLCGGPGAAYLYVRPDGLLSRHPVMTGWFSQEQPFAFGDDIDYAHSARRFLGGTPGMSALYAARSGYEILLEVGVERIRRRNIELCRRLIDGARARGLHVNTPQDAQNAAPGVHRFRRRGPSRSAPRRPAGLCRLPPALRSAYFAPFLHTEDEIDHMFEELDAIRTLGSHTGFRALSD